jgi:hypothetical protein
LAGRIIFCSAIYSASAVCSCLVTDAGDGWFVFRHQEAE